MPNLKPGDPITVTGGLKAPAVVRQTRDGSPVANIEIAVDRQRGEDGKWYKLDKPIWHKVAVWRQSAENLRDSNFKPGDRLIVDGTYQENRWTTEEGESRVDPYISADEIGPSLAFRTATLQRPERTTSVETGSSVSDGSAAGASI